MVPGTILLPYTQTRTAVPVAPGFGPCSRHRLDHSSPARYIDMTGLVVSSLVWRIYVPNAFLDPTELRDGP